MFTQNHFHARETIARTLFLTSVVSFVVFLAADLLRPGFVSRYLSVHWFLGVAILAGLWWAREVKEPNAHAIVQGCVASLCSIAGIAAVWSLHQAFGEYVLVAMILAGLLPFILWRLLRHANP